MLHYNYLRTYVLYIYNKIRVHKNLSQSVTDNMQVTVQVVYYMNAWCWLV